MKFYSTKGKERRAIFFMILPCLLGFIVFCLIPILSSGYISLTEWDLIGGAPEFLGFENYMEIFKSKEFWSILKNTLLYIVLYIPGILITSTLVAVLFNTDKKGISVFRVLLFIPVLTSWVAGALIWKSALSPEYGFVNQFLQFFGITGPAWLQDPIWAMPAIVMASIWKDLGYFSLIIFGGLRGIDKSVYEAAKVDGSNKIQTFFKITLPLVTPTLFFVVIMTIINSFQIFPQIMVMTGGGPLGSTQVFVERIYTYAFKYFEMGYASAFSWILFIIILLVTLVQFKLQKKWVYYDEEK